MRIVASMAFGYSGLYRGGPVAATITKTITRPVDSGFEFEAVCEASTELDRICKDGLREHLAVSGLDAQGRLDLVSLSNPISFCWQII